MAKKVKVATTKSQRAEGGERRRPWGLRSLVVSVSWFAILCFHLIEFLLPLLFGGLHLLMSLPIASQTQSHIRIPLWLLRVSGVSYLVIAVMHASAAYKMMWRSGRNREWVFATRTASLVQGFSNSQQIKRKSHVEEMVGFVQSSISKTYWFLSWPLRMWRGLFGLHGIFGLHGKYFDEAYLAREVFEITLQTYQLHALSSSVSTKWINELAVSTLALNCFLTPLMDLVYRHESHHCTKRRLAHLLLDMGLDFGSTVVIPACILYPYVAGFDWSLVEVPPTLAFSDVWYANAVACVRHALVTSVVDYVSSMLPHMSFLGCLATLKQLLTRYNGGDFHRGPPRPESSKFGAVVPVALEWISTRRPFRKIPIPTNTQNAACGMIKKHGLQGLFLLWGSFILAIHLIAGQASIHETRGCRLGTRPWFSKGVPCSVLQVNCYLHGIQGIAHEMDAVLRPLARPALAKLILTHCPALEMPQVFTEFDGLISLDIYNSTLVDWPMDAALTQTSHPAVGYVYIMHTNMTAFPAGLLHSDIPSTLSNFRLLHTNLTQLPDSLGPLWGHHKFYSLAVEHMALGTMPQVLQSLQMDVLALTSCGIDHVDDDFFIKMNLLSLYFSGNPVQKLPASFGDPAILTKLTLESTRVETLTPWLEEWLERPGRPNLLWLHGSPVCAGGANSSSLISTGDCTEYHDSVESSLDVQYILPQRGLEFE